MEKPIFKIDQLQCGYLPGKVILEISDLQIPRGKLIFVVGVSGGGKSTFLETLGLMNNTIQKDSEFYFIDRNEESFPVHNMWSVPSERMDAFRREYFSFIFQKTNLMPNFTCGENMVLPAMFKGQDFNSAKLQAFKYMDLLDLRREIFDGDITEISGGQRQRLAFIRAMIADFSILFGDEPTGNLDASTARDMMKVLKNYLHQEGKTGILVSHDLKLAEEFADQIIPIEIVEDQNLKRGVVKNSSILYHSKDGRWRNENTIFEQLNFHLNELIA